MTDLHLTAGPTIVRPGEDAPEGSRRESLFAFWIGRRSGARLPYVLRLPVAGEGRLFLAAREPWPMGKDVFCLELDRWPDDADTLEEVPVEACWRAGAAVHLVLRRPRQRRSMFVWTRGKTGSVVFWRSATSMRASRPGVRVPTARGLEGALTIAVDVTESRPWRFAGRAVTVERRRLPVGDYAIVRGGRAVAVVERKRAADLASGATAGELGLAVAELDRLPHAALVVEGRFSDVLKAATKGSVRPGWLLNVIAALQVDHPRVQWIFAETPALAEDWAYRWLAAASRADARHGGAVAELVLGEPAFQPELALGHELLDAGARRADIVREAEAGKTWTTRELAARFGVSYATALHDVNALVRDALLAADGAGRSRRYRATGTITLGARRT